MPKCRVTKQNKQKIETKIRTGWEIHFNHFNWICLSPVCLTVCVLCIMWFANVQILFFRIAFVLSDYFGIISVGLWGGINFNIFLFCSFAPFFPRMENFFPKQNKEWNESKIKIGFYFYSSEFNGTKRNITFLNTIKRLMPKQSKEWKIVAKWTTLL